MKGENGSYFTRVASQAPIGRNKDNDIQIDKPDVSAHHARIAQEGQPYFIEDTNYTNVNSQP